MATGELLDVAWQFPDEAEGIVVAHWSDQDGGLDGERFPVESEGGLAELPDEVSRIIEEDGREYGVWTRR